MAMKRTREDDPNGISTANGEEMKISEMEMEAAQQLIHLSSDEENLSLSCSSKNNEHAGTLEEITSRKINDIFWNGHIDPEGGRKAMKPGPEGKNKLKKYRTIQSIYMETRPLRVVYANKGLSVRVVYSTDRS